MSFVWECISEFTRGHRDVECGAEILHTILPGAQGGQNVLEDQSELCSTSLLGEQM